MGATEVLERLWREVSVPYRGERLPLRQPTVKSIHAYRERLRDIHDGAGAESSELQRGELFAAAALQACSDLSEEQAVVVIRTSGNDAIEIISTVMEMMGQDHFLSGDGDGAENEMPAEDSQAPDTPLS